MRAFLLAVLAVALAVPAVAIADRGSDDRPRTSYQASKSAKQKRASLRKAKRSSPRVIRATDDEREVKGRIVSLAPLRVGTLTCVVPSSLSVSAFRVGDFVEVTCDLVRGQWVLRKLKLEDDNEVGDDERELTARIVSILPLTVGSLTCVVPTGVSLAGFRVGDLVEITCDRIRGQWLLRTLEHEDRDDEDRVGRNDNSGPGNGDDDDDDGGNSGPGHGDDDRDDNSGPGNGGDDDDDSGSGGSGRG
jgi:hypothetical protein